jgi:hypothetical protein
MTRIMIYADTTDTRLWHINTAPPQTPQIIDLPQYANASMTDTSPQKLVQYMHAALGSPSITTMLQAFQKGYLVNFPGLTVEAIRKYPPYSVATDKGHLDQTRKNLRSTKDNDNTVPTPDEIISMNDGNLPNNNESEDKDMYPVGSEERTHHCYAAIVDPSGQIYTDLTGRFLLPSSTGNNYMLVLYDYDSNMIWAEPIKNRTAPVILNAYKKLHKMLCRAGLRPKLQRLDNECSDLVKEYMRDEHIDFQLAPPGVHRRNAAERAIRTFKNHFISTLCTVDKDFPLHLWDKLVPQALISLNSLRGSRINPKLSAWAQVHGNFDYNRTPIAPPGMHVLIHEKPDKRGSWAPHAVDAWYLGPALESYRCYNVWIWDTCSERITDTVGWIPNNLHGPAITANDIISASLADIKQALTIPDINTPLVPLDNSHADDLKTIADILLRRPQKSKVFDDDEITWPTSNCTHNSIQHVPTSPTSVIIPTTVQWNDSISTIQDNTSMRVDGTPLRVETVTTEHITLPPAHTMPASEPTTYQNCTGHAAKRRKRLQRNNKAQRIITTSNNAPFRALSATNILPDHVHLALLGHAINPDTGMLADYKELSNSSDGPLWRAGNADEIGRLCDGHGKDMPTGTKTMRFIAHHQVPHGKKCTYLNIVAAYRPEKEKKYRIRWTVGGNLIIYAGDVTTKTAEMVTAKILFNSVISTPGARFMTLDIKDFFWVRL